MSEYIHESHHVKVLFYYLYSTWYFLRNTRVIFAERVGFEFKDISLEVEVRYQAEFLETGTDKDHIHFLIQTAPTHNITMLVMIKSLTGREILYRCPEVKKQFWGRELWSDGCFSSMVDNHGDESTKIDCVRSQEKKQNTKSSTVIMQIVL